MTRSQQGDAMRRRTNGAISPPLQQHLRDGAPLIGEWAGRGWALRAPIPVACVVEIAFAAVEVGMHPGAVLPALIHDDAMRFVPLVLAYPPQRRERRRQPRRWFWLGKAISKLSQSHRGVPSTTCIPPRGRC